jgi:hypothetical protein
MNTRLYAVRLPNKYGWHTVTVDADNAQETVAALYPNALETRFVDINPGVCLLEMGWDYDGLEQSWLAPGENLESPECHVARQSFPPVPAVLTIQSEPPHAGWWDIYMHFSTKDGGHDTVVNISYSDVFSNPEKDILGVSKEVAAFKNARTLFDEEGQFVHILALNRTRESIFLRVESILRDDEDNNFCHDFLLDRENFVSEFARVYREFEYDGGWDRVFIPRDPRITKGKAPSSSSISFQGGKRKSGKFAYGEGTDTVHFDEDDAFIFYLAINSRLPEWDQYSDCVPIHKTDWAFILKMWADICAAKTFDELFELVCGVDYVNRTIQRQGLYGDAEQLWATQQKETPLYEEFKRWADLQFSRGYSYITVDGF